MARLDDILNQVVAITASALGTKAVSRNNFAVLETSASTAAIVTFNGVTSEPDAMGTGRARRWTIGVDVFVKDTGNPTALLDTVASATDALLPLLEAAETWNGVVDIVQNVTATFRLEDMVQAGGAAWVPVSFVLEALDFE